VEDGVAGDPAGSDNVPLRANVWSVLLASHFGQLLAAPVPTAPTPLQTALLARLWDVSRACTATSLLALVRGFATQRAGANEYDALRISIEGVRRLVVLTSALPDFVTTLMSAPAPQLSVEVAAYLAQAPPDVASRVAVEPVPVAWRQAGLFGDGIFARLAHQGAQLLAVGARAQVDPLA
jgi:hypothetical protein